MDVEFANITGGSIYAATGNGSYGTLTLRNSVLRDLNQYDYLYVWYPTGDCFIEQNVFINSGGISVGTDTRTKSFQVLIRNNSFYDWTAPSGESFAVQNWASYGSVATIVEKNSFWNTDRVALRLPKGYSGAAMAATNNYWGTTNEAVIQSMIFDKNDDLGSAGTIEYRPVLTASDPATPVR